MKKIQKITICILLIVVVAGSCFMLSSCNKRETLNRDYSFSFDITTTTVWDIMGIPLAFTPDSGLYLSKDGTATITITLNSSVSELLKTFNIDLSGVSSVDLGVMGEKYGKPILPWFNMQDLKTSLEALKQSLHGELILDYDEEATQKMLASLQETGHLNEDFEIPKTFGIRYSGKYEVKHLKSAITGEEYTAIYLDDYSETAEPYLMLTLTENEDGLKHASLRVEFLNMTLGFNERV